MFVHAQSKARIPSAFQPSLSRLETSACAALRANSGSLGENAAHQNYRRGGLVHWLSVDAAHESAAR